MTSLERRYRRLLRIYPAAHRAAYEEEMIGVLMSGAAPGRRLPGPADAFDLVRAGLTVRFGRAFHTTGGTGWRDVAAVTGLFAALLLAGAGINRLITGIELWGRGDPLRLHGVDGLMLLDPAMRSVIWSLAVAAAVLGLRRVTVVLALTGVLVQAVAVGLWSVPMNELAMVWGFGIAIAAAALFAAAVPGRWIRPVLGGRGVALAVAGAVLAVATRASALDGVWAGERFSGRFFDTGEFLQDWLPTLALAAAAWAAGPWLRGRILVVSAALWTAAMVLQDVPGLVFVATHGDLDSRDAVSRIVVLLLAPVVVLGGGLAVLAVRERLAGQGHGQVKRHE
ncbi:hypothetical protein [Actinoplanes philippinensis]|uniref:hypothetical protein n=1 Tax=Actinoplanes philippinensis TaxID=35752 RepID=UPI0033EEFE3F